MVDLAIDSKLRGCDVADVEDARTLAERTEI